MKFLKNLRIVSSLAMMTSLICLLTHTGNSQVMDAGAYGAGITNERYVEFDDLMTEMGKKDTVQATLIATVDEVCQVKGCWMTLNNGLAGGPEIMVRFKDYGFFVPKDIGGRKVVVEGKAFISVTPVEELRHYAEDAGKSKEEIMKITAPEETYSFEATGVQVLAR